ncbi:MAG: hypothetical protein ACOX8S_03450 [Christensenellales bacterium]
MRKMTAGFAPFFALLLISLITLTALFPGSAMAASAEADISVSYSTTPEYIYDEGYVDINIDIEVTNGVEHQRINLMQFNLEGQSYAMAGSVFSGDKRSFDLENVFISEDDFGSSIFGYLLYQDFSGSLRTLPMEIVLEKSQAQLSLERSISPLVALPGDIIFLSYTVENPSDKVFLDVRIEDPAVGTASELERIGAGEKVEIKKEIIYSKPFFSQPVMTYRLSGSDEIMEKSVSAVDVTDEDMGLELCIYSDQSKVDPGQTFNIVGSMKNTGEDDMTDVRICFGALGRELILPYLKAGDCYVFSKEVLPIADREYIFSAEASTGDGRRIAVSSDPLAVDVSGDEMVDSAVLNAYSGQNTQGVEFEVEPNMTEMAEPGEATFQIKMKIGSGRLSDIVISEKNMGEVARFDTLVIGDKATLSTIAVFETSRFEFKFEATDENGLPVIVQAEPITIRVQNNKVASQIRGIAAMDNAVMVSIDASSASGLDDSGLEFSLITLLMILATLVAICIIVLMSLFIKEKYVYKKTR